MMGSCEFICTKSGKNAKDAFDVAVEHAQWERGHGGYSGTIAEKSDFRMCDLALFLDVARASAVRQMAYIQQNIEQDQRARDLAEAMVLAKKLEGTPSFRDPEVARALAREAIQTNDKWDPADCAEIDPDPTTPTLRRFLFFGLASS